MTAILLPEGKQSFTTAAGVPLVLGKVFTWDTGTSNPRLTWADAAQTAPNANPIILDARGEAVIFWSGAYRVQLQDSTGAIIWTVDGIQSQNNTFLSSLIPGTDNAFDLGSAAFAWRNLYLGASDFPALNTDGLGYWLPTTKELSTGINIVNPFFPPGHALRYGPNTVPGTTDVIVSIQAAVDNASAKYPEVRITDDNKISRPIIIGAATQQNLSIIGTGRVSTFIEPNAADIKQAPELINALIINKTNNGHLHLEHIRFLDASAYTGKILYCVENGGADGLAQACFSAVFRDCWFGLSSNNTGFMQGGFSNLLVEGCVSESTKNATWWLKGLGNGDLTFTDNVCNNGFDNFIFQDPDDNLVAMLQVNGLKMYQWLRDVAVSLCKAVEVQLHDIIVEANVANVGGVGVASLTNVLDFEAARLMTLKTNAGARAAVGMKLNGSRGKISDCTFEASTGIELDCTTINVTTISNAAQAVVTTAAVHHFQTTQFVTHFGLPGAFGAAMNGVSLQVTVVDSTHYTVNINSVAFGAFGGAAGTTQADLDIEMYGVDLTGCEYGINLLGGGVRFVTGRLRTYGCKFNRQRQYVILHQFASALNWYSHDDEFLDAGMDGVGTARILSLGSSGEIVIIRPRIGRTTNDAAASYCVDAYGTGTVRIIDPICVGTMPSGFNTGAQAVSLDGVDSSTPIIGTQYPFTPNVGGTATYTLQQGRWSLKNKTLTFNGRLTINAIGTGNQTVVSGLPFTSHAAILGVGSVPFFAASATAVTSLGLTVGAAGTTFTLRSLVAAAVATANNNILQNATDIIFSGSYPLP